MRQPVMKPRRRCLVLPPASDARDSDPQAPPQLAVTCPDPRPPVTSAWSRTILICSGKGGVGKTTLTANLGIALARQGTRTAVLDADFGLRNLDLLLGLENRIVYTAQEVLAETAASIRPW